ncbi:MAG TPA: class III extradiol ring-cleavage dioxygenase [Jatrophihabitans sp.]|jgi:4,5-DOPA dioxygenase extradiol|uniref:dioxygenase family protein n=1 Tax=Jatrophihabitans sp. TaxID=1932789 RepID=UPI002DF7E3B2|nr:class III extradiol ring-cleavage dioxygenase [Jatrophihabitans sp.]
MTTMPVLYLSHGAPPLADDRRWTRQLADWSAALPKPRSILMVSAHWEEAPVSVSATTPVPLVHDFWGFPKRYYDVTYAAPGAPELAASVAKLLDAPGRPVHQHADRGLDHGAYVPLVEMYPEADVPVLQLSLPTLDPATLVGLGRRLAPLREEGVLIVGSGFTTHNLAAFNPSLGPDYDPPSWSTEFDAWAAETMARRDLDALVDFLDKAPAGHLAHPRTEHFAPLFVSLGAAGDAAEVDSVVDGFWFGLSKRSWQLG